MNVDIMCGLALSLSGLCRNKAEDLFAKSILLISFDLLMLTTFLSTFHVCVRVHVRILIPGQCDLIFDVVNTSKLCNSGCQVP